MSDYTDRCQCDKQGVGAHTSATGHSTATHSPSTVTRVEYAQRNKEHSIQTMDYCIAVLHRHKLLNWMPNSTRLETPDGQGQSGSEQAVGRHDMPSPRPASGDRICVMYAYG